MWLVAPLLSHAAGCGYDLGIEVGGVLVEEITFTLRRELTGEPICQGPPTRCGPPGLLALIIPDCPLHVACFGEVCNDHDRCYGACGSSKEVCDDYFLESLLDTCDVEVASDDELNERCVTLAYIYWQAVVRYGQLAFDIAQTVNCGCLGVAPPDPASSKLPVEASREFHPYDDLDDDLMPDSWERAAGLDANDAADARRDPDEDRIINLEEFIYGGDPFVPARNRLYDRPD